jgi:hypothetical protein
MADIVQVTFLDHCQGSRSPVKCKVYGRLIKVTPKKLVVRCWNAKGVHNCEEFCVVASTVTDIKYLKGA